MPDKETEELKGVNLNIRNWWSPFDYVRRFFIDSKIGRSIAYVVGMTKQGALPINATEDGALVVAPTGTGAQDHTSASVSCPAGWTDVINSADVFVSGLVWIENADAEIQISLDGVAFSPTTIYLYAGQAMDIDRRFRRIQARSKSPTSQSTLVNCIGYKL